MSNQDNTRAQGPGSGPSYYTQQPQQAPMSYGYPSVYGQPQMQMQSPYQQSYPQQFQLYPSGQQQNIQPGGRVPGMLPMEQSYVENILRLNRGKLVKAYMTFENSSEQQVFQGTIEAAGRDHLILRNPQTEERYLLLMVYLDYVVFPGQVEYDYPYNAQAQGFLSTSSPRASGSSSPAQS